MRLLHVPVATRAICLLVGWLLMINPVQSTERISSSFELTVAREENSHRSNGVIYYAEEGSLTVYVISPVEQWMVFDGDTLLILYPAENRVTKIPSLSGEVTLPIFQLIVNTILEDLGLVEAGYKLKETSLSGDTITAIWRPPRASRNFLGDLKATYVKDSLVSVVTYDASNKVVSRQVYSNYLEAKGRLLPRKVEVTRYGKADSVLEAMSLKDLKFDSEFPDEVRNFVIPKDAEVTTVEW